MYVLPCGSLASRVATYCTPGAPGTDATRARRAAADTERRGRRRCRSGRCRNSASLTPASAFASAPLKSCPCACSSCPRCVRATTAVLRSREHHDDPDGDDHVPALVRVGVVASDASRVSWESVAELDVLGLSERQRTRIRVGRERDVNADGAVLDVVTAEAVRDHVAAVAVEVREDRESRSPRCGPGSGTTTSRAPCCSEVRRP